MRKDERILDKKQRRNRCETADEIMLPVPVMVSELPSDYPKFLVEVKRVVAAVRTRTLLAANVEMTMMYWQLGRMILARQDAAEWGAKIIDRLSTDLKKTFPGMSGFSPRNLKYMRKFAAAWPDGELVQRTVAQIPWRSNLSLLDKLDDNESRLWYAQEVIRNGWSKEWLDICIENRLKERTGAPLQISRTFFRRLNRSNRSSGMIRSASPRLRLVRSRHYARANRSGGRSDVYAFRQSSQDAFGTPQEASVRRELAKGGLNERTKKKELT